MATRKSRLNTDSPTPNSGSDSTPTTPTAIRKRPGRKPTNETSKSDKLDDEVRQITDKKIIPESSPSRRRPQTRIGIIIENTKTESDDTKLNSPATKVKRSNRNCVINAKAKKKLDTTATVKPKQSIRARRNSTGKLEIDLKRSARLSTDKLRSGRLRKTLLHNPPDPNKIKVGRKRLKLNNDKTDVKAADEKSPKKIAKIVKTEPLSDSELLPLTTARRRSDSMSKCSDLTDASSFMDVPLLMLKDEAFSGLESQDNKKTIAKEPEESIDNMKLVEIEDENQQNNQSVLDDSVDKDKVNLKKDSIKTDGESKTNTLKNVTPALNDSGIGENDGLLQITKEKVEKKSNVKTIAKSKGRFPLAVDQKGKKPARLNVKNKGAILKAKTKAQAKIGLKKAVQRRKELIKTIAKNPIVNPVHIETIIKSPKPPLAATIVSQPLEVPIPTAAQASPLVQEEPSLMTAASPSSAQIPSENTTSNTILAACPTSDLPEINVNQFYGRSEFLENNLGIEKDPKLVEIVQVHEKNILDNSSCKNGEHLTNEISDVIMKDDEGDSAVTINKEDPSKEDSAEISSEDQLKLDDSCGESISAENKEMSIELDEEKPADEKDSNVGKEIIENGINIHEEIGEIMETTIDSLIDSESVVESSNEESNKNNENITKEGKHVDDAKCEMKTNEKESIKLIAEDKKAVCQEEIKVETAHVEMSDDPNGARQELKEAENEFKIDSINEKEDLEKHDEKENCKATEIEEIQESNIEILSINSLNGNSNPTDIKPDLVEPDNKENILSNFKEPIDEQKLTINEEKMNNPPVVQETAELVKQKESHLMKLGLLSHKAAVAAKIEKQKRREILQKSVKPQKNAVEYTGTLKTVIKLRRPSTVQVAAAPDRKKPRESLKMTLHKGRAKGAPTDKDITVSGQSDNDNYYTIQNEVETSTDSTNGGQSRKIHNRSHTSDALANESFELDNMANVAPTSTVDPIKSLVIPEKASSFRIHPGKLCQDQCFYCGGKFGLFDTPCHVAQIKSLERQKNILDNEEKLTVDNCLCDACFRHVDRRANCPSYKKRLSAPPSIQQDTVGDNSDTEMQTSITGELSPSTTMAASTMQQTISKLLPCQVIDCMDNGTHSVRRKWYMKMRKAISKLLNLNVDGHATILSICDKHYDVISHLIVCALCKRKLVRNHVYYITQDTAKLQELLTVQGVPVVIGSSLIVCKLCRYYSNILLKPPESKNQKMMFAKNYRRRLLQFHNIEIAVDSDTDNSQPPPQAEPTGARRGRPPKRARKSTPELQSPQMVFVGNNSDDNRNTDDQVILDSDVIVDYDSSLITEISIEPKPKKLMTNTIIISTPPKQPSQKLNDSSQDLSILRSNPNISMRELFPGEEEMGLQVNIPFNLGGVRTPEGWTKVQTVIQYDEPTRRLWEELQKPYGNQSSFLRHLILLEKYFRNGELILTENATDNATVYSESVQQRLKSLDSNRVMSNGPAITMKSSDIPKNSQTNRGCQKPTATQTTSLLRPDVNVTQRPRGRPPNCLKDFKGGILTTSTTKKDSTQTALENRIIKAAEAMIKTGVKSTKIPTSLPPELICISTGAKAGSILQASQQQQQQPQSQPPPLQPQQHIQPIIQLQPPKSQTQELDSSAINQKKTPALVKAGQNVIRLPNVLSPSERLEIKTWRPTLMPVTAGPPALDGQLYQTVDGRKLPNLVQVQSGGKPYLISIHDYNRMCIVRRERLLRDQMLQRQQMQQQVQQSSGGTLSKLSAQTNHSNMQQQIQQQMQQAQQQMQQAQQQLQQQVQHQAQQQLQHVQQQSQQMHQLLSAISKPSTSTSSIATTSGTTSKVHIPNTVLEQNSVIPLSSSMPGLIISNAPATSKTSVLDSLLKVRKPNNNTASLLKSNLNLSTKTTVSSIDTKVISITSTPSISAILGANTTIDPQPISTIASTNGKSSQSALEALFKTTQQTSTGNNMWIYAEALGNNGSNSNTNIGSVVNCGPIIDSSAANLLAKIPKSLTVIPQQKGRPSSSSKSSGDEMTLIS